MMTQEPSDLEPELREIQERARRLARQVAPMAAEADEMSTLHPGVADALTASGLAALVVPTRFGGTAGETVDPLAIALVREALMYESSHLDTLFAMQGIGSYGVTVAGSDALREEWLPRVASLEAIAALALTEPEVGSDLRGISTTVESTADGVRVRGRKSFITNGGAADFYCVLGREGDGYSLVLVPTDTDGLSTTPGAELIGPHILGELDIDVVVPEGNRIGEVGKGFRLVLSTLAVFRVSVAGAGVGLAQAALDEALRHAVTREQFGKPLAALGAVSQSLARSWAEIESARALTYRAARLARHDPFAHLDFSSLAKLHASEVAGSVADRSLQTMGRFGLIRGSKIERLYREARALRIYEGATEVLLDSLSRRLIAAASA